MPMRNNIKPAKILLFGEYALLAGGEGLAMPYPYYNARWQLAQVNIRHAKHIQDLQNILSNWQQYIKQQQDKGILPFAFDHNSFERDLKKGLYCLSDIPQGYGLGSSGALTALLYDKYVLDKIIANANQQTPNEWTNITLLQQHLALLEAYFHGTSSGIDPLVSYLNYPLHITNKRIMPIPKLPILTQINPENIENEHTNHEEYYIFLYNTHLFRQTAPLVQQFKNKIKDNPNFAAICQQQLTMLNKQCIELFINEQKADLYIAWQNLSNLQFKHFDNLIPCETLKKTWQKGVENDDFYLKLCGAGGGGFMLGITQKPQLLPNYFHEKDIVMHRI